MSASRRFKTKFRRLRPVQLQNVDPTYCTMVPLTLLGRINYNPDPKVAWGNSLIQSLAFAGSNIMPAARPKS